MELKIDIKRLEEIRRDPNSLWPEILIKICWFWRLAGIFKRKGNKILFVDIPVDENINLIANLPHPGDGL